MARPDSECASNVVQLARDAASLGHAQPRRPRPHAASWSWASSSSVWSWLSRPRRMNWPVHRQQQAQQRGGDGRLDGRMCRQADGHSERGRDRSGDGRSRGRRQPDRRRSRPPCSQLSRPAPSAAERPAPPRTPPISPLTAACAAMPRRAQPHADRGRQPPRRTPQAPRPRPGQRRAGPARDESWRSAVTTTAMNTTPSGRSACRWASPRSRARVRASATRADAGSLAARTGSGRAEP